VAFPPTFYGFSTNIVRPMLFGGTRFKRYSLGSDGQDGNDTAFVWDDGCYLSLCCFGLG